MSSANRFACEANHVGSKACEEKKCCFDYNAGYWDVACYYPIGKILINFIMIITSGNQQSRLVAKGVMVVIVDCLQ